MKRTLFVVAGILGVVILFGVMALNGAKRAKEAAALKGKEGHTVARGDIRVQVIETGTIDALLAVEVKSQVSGRLAKLLVKEGDLVTKGQLIAVIDPQETRNRVDGELAQLRGAQSSVKRSSIEMEQRRVTAAAAYDRAKLRVAQLESELRIQPTLTKSAISQAEASYKSALQARDELVKVRQPNERAAVESALQDARASRDNAQSELARRKTQYDKGYISLREYQDAQLNESLSQNKVVNAQARYDRLKQEEQLALARAEETIKQSRAELDRANANRIQDSTKRQDYQTALASLRDAQAALRDPEAMAQSVRQSQATAEQIQNSLRESQRLLGETEIRSPIDGIVTKKLVQEGELVTSIGGFSSGSPIVKIEDRHQMLVRLDINEIDVARLKLKMGAKITVDAVPNSEFTGVVTKLAPTSNDPAAGASSAVVKYKVEITFDKVDDRLKSGMNAKCTVTTLERKNVVVCPIEYVGKDDKGRFVMLAAKDAKGKPVRKDVTVGAESGAQLEVLSGLKGGESLVKPDYKGPERLGAFSGGD